MTNGDIAARIQDRLGEFNPSGSVYYTLTEIGQAMNAVQNLFVFLTLCLETTATFTLVNGQANYSMLGTYSDWLAPLRVRVTGGAKVLPATLSDLASLDSAWRASPGAVTRYSTNGFDFLTIYQQPAAGTNTVDITYAKSPAQMRSPVSFPNDTPAIPVEDQPSLIDGAIPFLRVKEGQQEFQKVLPLWERFIEAARKRAAYIRARNIELGYDTVPVETERFDSSVFLKGIVSK